MAALVPLLALLIGAVAGLVLGLFLPRDRQEPVAFVATAALAGAALLAWRMTAAAPGAVLQGTIVIDRPLLWLVVVLCAAAAVVVVMLRMVFAGDARESELYVLLLFAVLGALLLAAAADFMVLLLGGLLSSVAGYALVSARRDDDRAMEALLKFYLFGALSNIALLLALVLLFGLTGTTGYSGLAAIEPGNRLALATALVLLMVGLGFKGGLVPAQFWVPDVYQGASLPVAALLSVLPKVAAVVAVTRLAGAFDPGRVNIELLLALIAAVTMTWGNLAAFRQEQLVRLLGYSSIAQAGYLLLAAVAVQRSAIAGSALLFAAAAYAAGNLTAFAAVGASGERTLAGLNGLSRRSPWVAFALGVGLLSLLGLPPLAGFVGKFLLFTALLQAGEFWLMALALANTALSLFYYLRVIAALFVGVPATAAVADGAGATAAWVACESGAEPSPEPRVGLPLVLAVVLAALTAALGVGAVVLLAPTGMAVQFLL